MKLKAVHVINFKSVRDSGEFSIDENVTCLVGKNEAGKTAMLEALSRVNPLKGQKDTFEALDYPRDEWSAYKERASKKPDDAIITTWQMEESEISAIAERVGAGALKNTTFTVKKGYYKKAYYDVRTDEQVTVKHLLTTHQLHPEVKAKLETARTLKELSDVLSAKTERSESEEQLLGALKGFPELLVSRFVIDTLSDLMPKFVFIPEYFRLPGQVSINDLEKKQASNSLKRDDHVFLALLGMVDATVKQLKDESQYERLTAELEAVSNRLTKEIFQYWSQNRHLRVKFLFDYALTGDPPPFNEGRIVRIRIENTRHNATISFDERSTGFVWFFSFLVWFSQAKRNYGDNLIILLDEPGLGLHAKAQADLLRYMEERLAPNFQVIYTAHSPFMIDPRDLLRVRTVEDVFIDAKEGQSLPAKGDMGTKVGDKVLSTDPDTVFPLQACLGYEISQTLFVGHHSLLVEGPTELLYFEWFKRKLAALRRGTLDARWTIVPCGGIDRVPAFLSLFAGNKLHIAVFTDLAAGVKKRVRDLRESKLLRDGHVLTADAYAGQAEADIEDLIGRDTYRELVHRAYELASSSHLPAVRPAQASVRVVKEVENHFATLPPEVPAFDHYKPAEFLTLQGAGIELPGLELALEHFEGLFKDLNALLPARSVT